MEHIAMVASFCCLVLLADAIFQIKGDGNF